MCSSAINYLHQIIQQDRQCECLMKLLVLTSRVQHLEYIFYSSDWAHRIIVMSYSFTSTSIARSTSSPADGSRTITVTIDPTKEESSDDTPGQGSSNGTARVLRLRGARNTESRVAWDSDVIDNEHMDKKKSKSAWLTSVFLIFEQRTK